MKNWINKLTTFALKNLTSLLKIASTFGNRFAHTKEKSKRKRALSLKYAPAAPAAFFLDTEAVIFASEQLLWIADILSRKTSKNRTQANSEPKIF